MQFTKKSLENHKHSISIILVNACFALKIFISIKLMLNL